MSRSLASSLRTPTHDKASFEAQSLSVRCHGRYLGFRPAGCNAENLTAGEALEMSDDRPQRPKAEAGLAIDRFDAGLAHKGVLCCTRVVPPKRPDSPAHTRNRPARPLIDRGERVPPEQVPAQEVRGGAGNSPARRPSKLGRVAEPDRLCACHRRSASDFCREAVAGSHLWVGQPFIEVRVHGRVLRHRRC
jgi:hypothetical protein